MQAIKRAKFPEREVHGCNPRTTKAEEIAKLQKQDDDFLQATKELSSNPSGGGTVDRVPSASCPHHLKSWGRRRKWMVDSGSSVNMLRRGDLTQTERECIGQADNPLNLSTANGPIVADEEMTFELKDLKNKDEAMILDHAPLGIGVLSMGRAVEEHDCAVWWTKKHGFLFMDPEGNWRKATVSKYVPCLTASDIENLDNYISGYSAESLPHDVSLVGMVGKLPKFVIEAICQSLEQRFARSPSGVAGNTAQTVANRAQSGGDP